MLRNIGTTELIIIALVMVLLFGGKKLPELTRGLSEASKEFTKGLKGEDNEGSSKGDKSNN
ncbi:MAG: twin-arginine translocase TatA/TatE family subunit [Patescibacteria group bacterium]